MKRISLGDPVSSFCLAACISLTALFLDSCHGRAAENIVNQSSEFQVVKTAKGFSIERHENYSVVTVKNPWQGAEDISIVHYLIRKGSAIPRAVDSSRVIFVPVTSIICMSTTHIGMITALNEANSITGLSGTGFVYSPEIIKRVEQGLTGEVGYETGLNQELIIKISPDLVMMYGIGSESAGHVNKIRDLGINVMFNADYLETDPLAKAEWIKLFGALYCKEEMADSIYNAEEVEYTRIKEFVNKYSNKKPAVLLGLPFKDTWYISPGNSFVSKLIDDAGGDYLWKNTSSSYSMPYSLENVYVSALDADYWLNIGTVNSSGEISLVDRRLADLKCFRNGNLYNNNKRITTEGGNDYWESGAFRPHLILKDIATILHPGIFPSDELYYYQKIN